MIKRSDMQKLANSYPEPSVATLGSHSALEIARGAKDERLKSIVVAKRGREKTYDYYNKSNGEIGCVDKNILVDEWSELASKRVIGELTEECAIFIPHRSFQVYLGYDSINNRFAVPIFGNRALLEAEERVGPNLVRLNQDKILEIANIPTPRKFHSPRDIDRRVIVKSSTAVGERAFERSFPIVASPEEYKSAHQKEMGRGKNKMEKELISSTFKNAPIQEYLDGEKININYFYSPLSEKLEIMGTDMRLQFPQGEELAHIPVSLKESLLELAYSLGERIVETCANLYKPGLIGPFALQTIAKENNKLVVYDVSFRTPGSPDSAISPYTFYTYGERVSYGQRISREINAAFEKDRIKEIIT